MITCVNNANYKNKNVYVCDWTMYSIVFSVNKLLNWSLKFFVFFLNFHLPFKD